ncbi:unnamed protein product [Ceutorhynchus assimilis]|uniref:Uncharacterized protein n=1 Tax=Ceutorhynchus assimilis TaxID=467358 RepID=A0A9N9QN45_9CUCU|nr:unnamed protein product [Ceutorhynchus assimilis]
MVDRDSEDEEVNEKDEGLSENVKLKQGRGVSTITFQWQRELQRRKLKKARGTIQSATTTEQASNQRSPTRNKVHYEKQTTGQESTTLDTLAQIPRHAGDNARTFTKAIV